MTKNSKEARKTCEKGYRKKVNWSLYLVTEERNENFKRNGEWKDKKEPKMARTRANGTKMNSKTLVEAEGRRKRMGGHKHYWKNGMKRQTNT